MSGSSMWPPPSVNGWRGRNRHRRGVWAAMVAILVLAAAAALAGIVDRPGTGVSPGIAGPAGARAGAAPEAAP